MSWSALPLIGFGLLNLLLAFAAARRVRAAAIMFALAGIFLLLGAWQEMMALVLVGLVLALIIPIWMGYALHGQPRWAHHLVRFVGVAVVLWLWLSFRPS